jgi:hypothetical protein
VASDEIGSTVRRHGGPSLFVGGRRAARRESDPRAGLSFLWGGVPFDMAFAERGMGYVTHCDRRFVLEGSRERDGRGAGDSARTAPGGRIAWVHLACRGWDAAAWTGMGRAGQVDVGDCMRRRGREVRAATRALERPPHLFRR